MKRGTVALTRQFLGRITPVDTEQLYFREAGRIAEVRVKEDDEVKPGQVLAELEMVDLQDQIDQAKVKVERARTTLAQTTVKVWELAAARARLAMAQIALDEARAEDPAPKVVIAKANMEKAALDVQAAELAQKLTPTRESQWALEKARLDNTVAQANFTLAQQDAASHGYRLQTLGQEVELANLDVQRIQQDTDPAALADERLAELELAQLQDRASRYRIASPIAGRILSLNVVPGQAIVAFVPVVVLGNPNALEISADLPISDTVALQAGMPILVELTDSSVPAFPGMIRRVPLVAQDRKDLPDTVDRSVRIRMEPPRGMSLRVGELVKLTVTLSERKDVLAVPAGAIRRYQGRMFAVVSDGEQRRRVDLKVGLEGDDRVEVKEGLSEGQVVVMQ